MFRRLKRELCFVGENIPVLGLGAFICCIGGVFLWVGGDSSWYYAKALHNEHSIPLGVIFTIWLLTYGMTGFVLAMSCLSEKLCSPKCGMKASVLGGFAYLLMLMWYAVSFCTRLAFFGIILLILSILLLGITFVALRKTFFITLVLIILIEVVQIYFLCFSISFYLLN